MFSLELICGSVGSRRRLEPACRTKVVCKKKPTGFPPPCRREIQLANIVGGSPQKEAPSPIPAVSSPQTKKRKPLAPPHLGSQTVEPSDAGTVSLQIYTKRSSIQQGVFGPSWAWVLKGSPGGVRSSAEQEAAGPSPAPGSPALERLGEVVAKGGRTSEGMGCLMKSLGGQWLLCHNGLGSRGW